MVQVGDIGRVTGAHELADGQVEGPDEDLPVLFSPFLDQFDQVDVVVQLVEDGSKGAIVAQNHLDHDANVVDPDRRFKTGSRDAGPGPVQLCQCFLVVLLCYPNHSFVAMGSVFLGF